ncbi:MAG: DUF1365 domain-containing protein [Hyphomicrobiales bacterium]|nr:DUF1365 domain-containing protein [Hyphomicrobiales bacterium]
MIEPGLYSGDVMHRRLRPRRHDFRYSAFWLAIDLDRLEATAARLRLLSIGRFNLFSFFARDHADGADTPLATKIRALVAQAGLDARGPLHLFAMPRVLGYVFNPLSIYFCSDVQGAPSAIVWEVSSTFGERHSYVIAIEDADDGVVRQHARKQLHVSPFIGMDIDYSFRVTRRGDDLVIGIVDRDAEGVLMSAALHAQREALTDRALLAAFARIPLATFKVVAAIHWEALRLWLKGAPFRRTPAGPVRRIGAHSAGFSGKSKPDDAREAA